MSLQLKQDQESKVAPQTSAAKAEAEFFFWFPLASSTGKVSEILDLFVAGCEQEESKTGG